MESWDFGVFFVGWDAGDRRPTLDLVSCKKCVIN